MEYISTIWLLTALAVLIIISAFFSGTETSMMAINHYRLKNLAKKNKSAKRVIQLLEHSDELIGTILLGNNLVNIFAASIATILALKLLGDGAVIVASLALTLIILIFAETAPKIFAAKYPEKIALPASWVILGLIYLFKPIVYLVNFAAKHYLRILGLSIQKNQPGISSDELAIAVTEAKYKISDNYQKMLLNILSLEKVTVKDIMIPKSEFIGIKIDNLAEITSYLQHSQHTRILVFAGDNQEIVGLLHMRNVANLYARDNFNLEALKNIIRSPYFVPESTTLSKQLSEFQQHRRRLALVVDEYGDIQGMVVLEDILEEIVGRFTSNQGENFNGVQAQKDGSYLVNAKISMREFNQILKTQLKSEKSKTLNGFLIEQLQEIPKHNIGIKVEDILFEVMQVGQHGIKLVKVVKVKTTEKD